MARISIYHIELLKKEVLKHAGLTHINPGDCRMISFKVIQKTKHRISETTIKRIYGFAFSKFQPSLFTLDSLAEFCNYRDWEHWQKQEEPVIDEALPFTWSVLKKNAERITGHTIQTLRNRAGIPFHYTICRDFIDRHMIKFARSYQNATVITAPAGYGKTIAICRWLEKRLEERESADTYLFFNCVSLMSAQLGGKDLHNWMQELLGYGKQDDIQAPEDIEGRGTGNFYFIVDGFDEHLFRTGLFNTLLAQITEVFSTYRERRFFKLMLTMRSSTWLNNRDELFAGPYNWFTGFVTENSSINVPLLNAAEITNISARINPASMENANPVTIAESFRNPLFLELYYRQHPADFSFKHIDHTSLYDLNALFVLNKVYLSTLSDDKVLLGDEIVSRLDLTANEDGVDKRKLLSGMPPQQERAYYELLGIGFLREVHEPGTNNDHTRVQFGNPHFTTHSIARAWLKDNNERFDDALIEKINTELENSPYRLSVAKWCIIHAIRTGQQDSFGKITGLKLEPDEKADLVVFLGDLLRNEFKLFNRSELLINYFGRPFSKEMFEYFFGMELINSDYKNTLRTLLMFNLPDHKRILVNTALGIIAVINLDLEELESCIGTLRDISNEAYNRFPVNPLDCLYALLQYFKYGIVNKDVLAAITRLPYSMPSSQRQLMRSASNDMLCLLACYTGYLFNNPPKLLRLVEKVNNGYRSVPVSNARDTYAFFIYIAQADAYFRMGEADRVVAIYEALQFDYRDFTMTPFMNILRACMKIKMLVITGQEHLIMPELAYVEDIAEQSGSKISKLYTMALLLKNGIFLSEYPEFKEQFSYDIRKISRDNALLQENFIEG
ncbi:hypothetical protein GCM10023149_14530 [Mucilaginibacter gynuensis]|uniref:NACHT domain-containing protein n=1 Tax=Mucilaginibacter gynuensis TaxID=1302236 RepID=A0ABP8G520_9SPHI